MAATRLNLRFEQGSRFFQSVDVPDDVDTGQPIDLTGFDGHFQVRYPRTGGLLVDLGTFVEITSNSIAIDISGDDTEEFDWNLGYYDLYITNGTDIYRLLNGVASVSTAVTIVP